MLFEICQLKGEAGLTMSNLRGSKTYQSGTSNCTGLMGGVGGGDTETRYRESPD